MTSPAFLNDTDFDAPEGYRSAPAKTRLITTVSIAGVLFFFTQIVVPQLLMLTFMPHMMGMGPTGGSILQVEHADVANATVWQGQVWSPVMRIQIGSGTPQHVLRAASLEGDWVKDSDIVLPFAQTGKLVADGDRLWSVSAGNVTLIEAGKAIGMTPKTRLSKPSPPFVQDDQLRILDRTPTGEWKLLAFVEGEWTAQGTVRLPDDITPVPGSRTTGPAAAVALNLQALHVLPTSPPSLVFTDGAACWKSTDIPLLLGEGTAVSALDALDNPWQRCPMTPTAVPVLVEGRLAAVLNSSTGASGTLSADWIDGAKAETFGTMPLGLIPQFSLVMSDGRCYVITDSFPPGRPRVVELTAAGFQTGQTATGKTLLTGPYGEFIRQYLFTSLLTAAATNLLLITYIVVLHLCVARWRNPTYAFAHHSVRLASIGRRAWGRAIDTFLFVLPFPLATYGVLNWVDVDAFVQRVTANPLEAFKLGGLVVLAGLSYVVVVTITFGTLEGLFGWTPGKLLAGVRVVRTTFQPIGVFRGMIRQVLLVIDGFANYLVGGSMVAVSAKQQRLGDLATDSIVIEAGSLTPSRHDNSGT